MGIHQNVMWIQRKNHEKGADLVSPSFHAKMKLPKEAKESRDFFNTALDNKPTPKAQEHVENNMGGITPKFFAKVGGVKSGKKIQPSRIYMLKPYYEDCGGWGSDMIHPYPSPGWAEMAIQGMMHAGGLGHMSQKVHVHQPSSGSPVLAVEIEPGVHRIAYAHPEDEAGSRWFGATSDSGRVVVPHHIREDAARLAAMDFLTNNQDRNAANLLFKPHRGLAHVEIGSLLSIDHGRSFHYAGPLRFADWGNPRRRAEDHLYDYLSHDVPGFRLFDLSSDHNLKGSLRSIANWWKVQGKNVTQELHRHLRGIKDPSFAKHVEHEFGQRAAVLDKLVTMRTAQAQANVLHTPRWHGALRVPLSDHQVSPAWHT
jgi:hypothetical protein